MTIATSTSSDNDLVSQLTALHQQWCAAEVEEEVQHEEKNAAGENHTITTPLDLARKAISCTAALEESTVEAIFSSLATSLRASSDTEANGVKLKRIQWHVAMILELWGKMNSNGKDAAWTDKCVALLEGGNNATTKKKRKRGTKQSHSKKTKSSSGKSKLLQHLVDTLSRATFRLPFGTSLSIFLSETIAKSHWEVTPDVVSHLYDTFEIPTPFLKTESDGEETYGFGFLSIAAGSAAAPLLDTKEEKTTTETTKKSAFPKKRRRDKNPVVQKQQKKQRLLSTLKQNRFKTTTNRTTHFHGKFKDISKLLEKNDSSAPSTTVSQDRHKKRLYSEAAMSIEKNNKSRKVPVITPHQTKLTRKDASALSQVAMNKRSSVTQHGEKSTAKKTTAKHVTIRESKSDQDLLMSPPARRSETVAATPPSDTTGQLLRIPQQLGGAVVGETPTKAKLHNQPVGNAVVGETPALKRSRSMVPEAQSGEELFQPGEELDDAERTLPLPSNTKPVQPVKLFGAIRKTKAKPLTDDAKKAKSVDEKKKKSGIKSIQMARALLRRRSI